MVTLPMAGAPLVCIDFWCRAGSTAELAGESGMAHFLEHMVFKGSQGLPAGAFDRRIEALGGNSNAATGFDDVHFHVLIPPDGAEEALNLLLDLVLRPVLEEEAFGMERQVVLEELAQSEDQPEEVAVQRLLALACPDHAYGEPILGRRRELLDHSPATMRAFHDRQYAAGRCLLVISGAVAGAGLLEAAASGPLAFLPQAALDQAAGEGPPPRLSVHPGRHSLTLERLEAARLLMAWWQPPASDLDGVMGADLATTVLAEGRRSRLVERLREQLRIVESIDLDLHPLECGSLALLEAVCGPDQLPQVQQAIETVWQDVMARPVTSAEWGRARRLVANGYRFALESAGGVAGLLGSHHLWGRQHGLEAPLAQLQHWSPERLRDQALSRLDPGQACILEVLPA